MTFIDPIGDMITRIRNAQMRLLNKVIVPSSKFRVKILDVLKQEGYISDYQLLSTVKNKNNISVDLKERDRLINVEWDIVGEQNFLVRLRVEGEDRKNMIKDLGELKLSPLYGIFDLIFYAKRYALCYYYASPKIAMLCIA